MLPYTWPPKLEVKQHPKTGKWWICGCIDYKTPRAGPYDKRKEAEEDRAGLARSYAASPDFWLAAIEADYTAAETWYETEYDEPAPARGSLAWADMWEAWTNL